MFETPCPSALELLEKILHSRNSREEEEAWSQLMILSTPMLRQVLRSFPQRTGKATHWELGDLCSELYLHLSANDWHRLRTYQVKPGTQFTTWLATVAYDLLAQKHRAMQIAAVSLDAPQGSAETPLADTLQAASLTPEEAVLEKEKRILVQEAIARLKHRQCQEIIRRHCYHEERLSHIAKEMGLKASSVRQTYKRNRDELRELLPSWVFAAG